mgnify:CR=1 FL=1
MRSITYNRPNQQKHCEDCGRRIRSENDENILISKCHVCHEWYEVETKSDDT